MLQHSDKPCVVLLGMGGPDKSADVREYLYNIFSDRSLIRLPGGKLFQRPLARLISLLRSSKVRRNYQSIGGGSPILMWTMKQAEQIEQLLSEEMPGFRCFVGMRYFHPLIEDTIAKALNDGLTGSSFFRCTHSSAAQQPGLHLMSLVGSLRI